MFTAAVLAFFLGAAPTGAVELTSEDVAVLKASLYDLHNRVALGYRTLRASDMPVKPPADLSALTELNRSSYASLFQLGEIGRISIAMYGPTDVLFDAQSMNTRSVKQKPAYYLSLPLIRGDTAYVYRLLNSYDGRREVAIVTLKRSAAGWQVVETQRTPFHR